MIDDEERRVGTASGQKRKIGTLCAGDKEAKQAEKQWNVFSPISFKFGIPYALHRCGFGACP